MRCACGVVRTISTCDKARVATFVDDLRVVSLARNTGGIAWASGLVTVTFGKRG